MIELKKKMSEKKIKKMIELNEKISIKKNSVAEPKLFISGSDFDRNFGSGSSYSHIFSL